MDLSLLAGNSPLKRQLSLETARRGLSHAYIISGPLPASGVRFIEPYTRSNRSMSTTKMVAPPTTTSTGMEG